MIMGAVVVRTVASKEVLVAQFSGFQWLEYFWVELQRRIDSLSKSIAKYLFRARRYSTGLNRCGWCYKFNGSRI